MQVNAKVLFKTMTEKPHAATSFKNMIFLPKGMNSDCSQQKKKLKEKKENKTMYIYIPNFFFLFHAVDFSVQ